MLVGKGSYSQPVSSHRFPIGHRFAGPPWPRRHPSPWRAQCALSLGVKTVLVFKRLCRLNPSPMSSDQHNRSRSALCRGAIAGESRRNKAGTKPDARFNPHPRRQPASLLDVHAEPGEIPEERRENEREQSTASQKCGKLVNRFVALRSLPSAVGGIRKREWWGCSSGRHGFHG